MAAANRLIGLIIQAFKSLGAAHITPQRLAHLRKTLPAAERARLLAGIDLAPAWMRPLLRELAQDNQRPAQSRSPSKKNM